MASSMSVDLHVDGLMGGEGSSWARECFVYISWVTLFSLCWTSGASVLARRVVSLQSPLLSWYINVTRQLQCTGLSSSIAHPTQELQWWWGIGSTGWGDQWFCHCRLGVIFFDGKKFGARKPLGFQTYNCGWIFVVWCSCMRQFYLQTPLHCNAWVTEMVIVQVCETMNWFSATTQSPTAQNVSYSCKGGATLAPWRSVWYALKVLV